MFLISSLRAGAAFMALGAFMACANAQTIPENAQLSPPQVRSRILDTCMVSMGREVSQLTPIYPACNCYATGLTKIMDGNDAVVFTRTGQVPSRLTPPAQQIYDQCRK
jgi:hypothetical protein